MRSELGIIGAVTAVGLITLLAGMRSSASAAGAAANGRVGSVNVGRLFMEFQRKKDLDEEMRQAEQRINLEMETRRNRIDSLQAVVDAMSPDDPTFAAKQRELLQAQIEFKNWFDLKQADMTREVGVWTTRIYQEINEAVAEVAQREGFEMVMAYEDFRPRSVDPEQVQEQIARRRVLYVSPSVDLTQRVLDTLNEQYRAQPRPQMLQLP